MGNGPFRFVSRRSGDRWVFEANPDYPEGLGGRPLLDRFVWRVIPENAAQLTEIRVGEVDVVLQPRPGEVRELAEREDLRAAVMPSREFSFIAWNGRRPPLDRAEVRRALAMAIDRSALLRGIRHGFGVLAAGPIMPFHWAYAEDVGPLPVDPDSARALLSAAGIQDRDDDGVLELADGLGLHAGAQVSCGQRCEPGPGGGDPRRPGRARRAGLHPGHGVHHPGRRRDLRRPPVRRGAAGLDRRFPAGPARPLPLGRPGGALPVRVVRQPGGRLPAGPRGPGG
ncbi:MAG: hypothetical protein GWM90_15440 [Gemmatimonadetes bacterium]|nr:hypothetical protein [Gemmatimonadota bacterium]NIQ55600.1 hypothetical protein [Gemmatimonadota bacterium]NIU75809.1 hypothetical protein [Gammaproteobacteria bacterium]NIX45446.1 hypothetical protein [Gemmatimonadota bacterium]NIY09735.1 hypothetical protein [Gemmatimonadota bacterium]